MMTYFDGTADIMTALLYGGLICLGATINCIIHHPYFLGMAQIGVKMRLATSGLIYKKVIFQIRIIKIELCMFLLMLI
jgi:hypothetical protein